MSHHARHQVSDAEQASYERLCDVFDQVVTALQFTAPPEFQCPFNTVLAQALITVASNVVAGRVCAAHHGDLVAFLSGTMRAIVLGEAPTDGRTIYSRTRTPPTMVVVNAEEDDGATTH